MDNAGHRIFSGIPHSSAGLFFMHEQIAKSGRYLIIVDEKKTYEKIRKIGELLTGKNIKPLSHIGELFALE
jgi:hypothetical protein